ncbi:hypothetical protein AYK26_00800 [Euryarchaeota archaeon SM23-78]|nr:MAG: hypothetical protein AYK26_00800 [Euryarchaeota archaeon SM23-78]MBW3001117.1 PIN domain-containing protein [Candidatus Woesearchaeota archaeon]
MNKESYYLDACVYLNIWWKEIGKDKNKLFWEMSRNFLENVSCSNNKEVIYSGFVLKELWFKIKNKELFKQKTSLFNKEKYFRFVKATKEDYAFARELESNSCYDISFMDCLHIAVCKRFNFTLVTRDKKLIKVAKKIIRVGMPEDFI